MAGSLETASVDILGIREGLYCGLALPWLEFERVEDRYLLGDGVHAFVKRVELVVLGLGPFRPHDLGL